jgi:hypothetical protein
MSFIPGLELSRRWYAEVVGPLLKRSSPLLPYAAARIGAGSEVLGFDTPMSTDHDWGPHLQLFLGDADAGLADTLRETLRAALPGAFYGFPIAMDGPGSAPVRRDPRHSAVWVTTCREHCWESLRYDVAAPLDAADWLTISSQLLLEMTAGAVFHDGVGELTALRARLAYYPHDIWLYLLAAGWERIGQEEHLMPRAGLVGDELGSALIGGRLVHDVMSMCFLIERRYAPYPKWFGSAFGRLACAAELQPLLWQAQQAATWQEREAALNAAYTALAHLQNELGLAEPLPATVSPFYGRPFQVIHGERFAQALRARIRSDEVRRIAARRIIGGIDQWSDSTDLRADITRRAALRVLYRGEPDGELR